MKPLPLLNQDISKTPGFELGDSLSFTRRKTAKTCWRKYALSYGLGLREDRTPQPLRMGSMFALALETADSSVVDETYQAEMDKTVDQDSKDLLAKEWGCVKVMAEAYLRHYGAAEEREVYLEHPIGDTGKLNRGYADFANNNRETLGEDKFRARWTWNQKQALKLDEQATSMISLARQLGHPAKHIVYRVTIRPYIRKTGTVEAFLQALAKDVDKLPEKYFHEQIVKRTDAQIERHRAQLLKLAQEVTDREKDGDFPENYDSCLTGSFACQFMKVCITGSLQGSGLVQEQDSGRTDKRNAPQDGTDTGSK